MVFYEDILDCDPRICLGEPSVGAEDLELQRCIEQAERSLLTHSQLALQLVEIETQPKPASPWDFDYTFDAQTSQGFLTIKRYNGKT